MDALASYKHLTDNVPSWLEKLEKLSAQVAEQHARFSTLTAATEFKLGRKKTGSTESLRPKEETIEKENVRFQAQKITDEPHLPPPNPEACPVADTTNDILAIKEARRKRKPGSALSAASGPQKYRTRTMVIVYYDSDIQDAFELLVRNIAGARNNLRKGKTAATFKARMASLTMGSPLFSAGGEPDDDDDATSLHLLKKPKRAIAENHTSHFDTIDKDLEVAQMSCERAAHQMLRDGDCKEELMKTRHSFQQSLELARKEVDRLQAEEAREQAEKAESDPPVVIHIEEKAATPPVAKAVEYTGTGAIEVDDISDAESVHVDLSAIRRARRV